MCAYSGKHPCGFQKNLLGDKGGQGKKASALALWDSGKLETSGPFIVPRCLEAKASICLFGSSELSGHPEKVGNSQDLSKRPSSASLGQVEGEFPTCISP